MGLAPVLAVFHPHHKILTDQTKWPRNTPSSGRQREPSKPNSTEWSLEELQAIVGGYVERCNIPGGKLYCNEEGQLAGLPINAAASAIVGSPIGGDVLIEELDVLAN